MVELVETWVGKISRDVILGAIGGYAAGMGTGVFGIVFEPAWAAIPIAILLIGVIIVIEEITEGRFWGDEDEDQSPPQIAS